MGGDGEFCKHCVAVGLVAGGGVTAGPLEAATGGEEDPAAASADPDADVRRYVEGLAHSELVALILDYAGEDDALFERLRLQAELARPAGEPESALRRAFDLAAGTREFVAWDEAFDYALGFEEVVARARALLESGDAAAVVRGAEYGIAVVEEALERTDDSGGAFGTVLDELGELHLDACVTARPEPVALARRLFQNEVHGEWGTFWGAAERYRTVLGEEGLTEYRRLAEAAWREAPALRPGDRADGRTGMLRWRVERILHELLGEGAPADRRVAILERDLTSPRRFLDIARIWREAGESDRALEWAERGLASFDGRPTAELVEFVANEYHRRERHAEAVALVWREFERAPGLGTYQSLATHARKAGEWANWRERALGLLRSQCEGSDDASTGRGWAGSGGTLRSDGSRVVQILLWETEVDAALEEARRFDCSPGLWRTLAERLEADRPADAIPGFQRAVEDELARKSKGGYAEATGLLGRIQTLFERTDDSGAFRAYLNDLVSRHRRKRNFMALLKQARMIP